MTPTHPAQSPDPLPTTTPTTPTLASDEHTQCTLIVHDGGGTWFAAHDLWVAMATDEELDEADQTDGKSLRNLPTLNVGELLKQALDAPTA